MGTCAWQWPGEVLPPARGAPEVEAGPTSASCIPPPPTPSPPTSAPTPSPPTPSPPAGGDPVDGCCNGCSSESWCSPESQNCYTSKRKDYYESCCCHGCGSSSFCSPISGNCYDTLAKTYYRRCAA